MFKSGVGGSPFAERNFHPHTTRRFPRRTKEKQKGNANRATLAVARKLVVYLLAVDRRQQDFVLTENRKTAA